MIFLCKFDQERTMDTISTQNDSMEKSVILDLKENEKLQPLEQPEREPAPGRMSLNNLKFSQQETVKWLRENYEVDNTICLPRDTIYASYSEFCENEGISKMGTASFGKMIRLVFPQIKTRRLGVRGQSKYYYHGVKVMDNSPIALKEMRPRSSVVLAPRKSKKKSQS